MTETYDPDELVSLATIAERHGVKLATVYGWRNRGHLGEPAKRFGQSLVYRWGDVAGLIPRRKALGRPRT